MKSDNRDIMLFLKGNKIANQVIELIRRENGDDKESLNDFIAQNPYSENLIENLTDTDKINEMRDFHKKSRKYENLRLTELKMAERSLKRHHRKLLTYSLSSAAAVLVVVALFVFRPSSVEKQVSVATISEPTLILGSGDNVLLSQDGNIEGAEVVGGNKISYMNSGTTTDKMEYNTIIIPIKYFYTVVLADGTEVLLNAGSELRYPTKFNDSKREVFLKGEGFFKVKKGEKPFVVVTQELSVRVYGTTFNVNTNNKIGVEALLVSGSVGVTVDNRETMITPSQLFSLDRNSKSQHVENVNIENYIAWTQNLFKCDNEKLSVMLDQISKWYGVEFNYLNSKIGDVKIDIKISRNSELSDILKALELVSGAVITNKNGKYVIE